MLSIDEPLKVNSHDLAVDRAGIVNATWYRIIIHCLQMSIKFSEHTAPWSVWPQHDLG
jgi:hypothetical protein